MKKRKISSIGLFHYFRLFFRGILFLLGVTLYVINRIKLEDILMNRWFLTTVWVIFAFEMILRFFPSPLESPGCQKQFARNYIKTGNTDVQFSDNNATVLVALIWVAMNGVIGALKLSGVLDNSIMLLLCLFYSVCDMICILFFCPFQSWFLKNKCCAACRIYNWDYAMMFTPCFFMPGKYTWSLLAAAVILLLRWEITVWLFPERFSENTNQYLACANCTEKLCTHKTQLMSFQRGLKRYADRTAKRILRNYGSKAEVRKAPKQH